MLIRGTTFVIGTDPEVFVRDKKTKRFVGANGLIPGTKEKPVRLARSLCKGQVDGMALEFNPPPVESAPSFAGFIHEGKRGLNYAVNHRGLEIVIQTTVEFDQQEWDRAPKEAKVLGCDPDFCAWRGVHVNEPPNADVNYRTGGGHISIGWGKDFNITEDFKEVCGAFAREMDALNGVASLLYDQDTKRRELYGKAGAFRPKPFGVEYRTLSNSWVRNSALSTYVARRTFQVARNMMSGRLIQTAEVEEIINYNKVEEAKYFLCHHSITLPPARYRVV